MAKKYVIGQEMQSTKRKDEVAWGVESSGGTACYLEGDQGSLSKKVAFEQRAAWSEGTQQGCSSVSGETEIVSANAWACHGLGVLHEGQGR